MEGVVMVVDTTRQSLHIRRLRQQTKTAGAQQEPEDPALHFAAVVQAVPPCGSIRTSPLSSVQNPLSPVLPTVCGTAVTEYVVNWSLPFTETLAQFEIVKVYPSF